MKRAKQLQPLSREHHLGLHLGRHGRECANEPAQIQEHWSALTNYINKDMTHHFGIEDNLLVNALLPYKDQQPKVANVLNELAAQHQELDQLTQLQAGQDTPTIEQVHKLANALYNHVRFEERELFPIAEQYLSKEELDEIYAASADNVKKIEESR